MPTRFPSASAPQPAPAAPIGAAPSPRPAQAPAPSPSRNASPFDNMIPDDEGLGKPPPREGGSGGDRRRAFDFADLPAGEYRFVCGVESIIKWAFGTTVTFKVYTGDQQDREIGWGQSPPPFKDPNGKAAEIWQRTFIEAYAAGGWTWDASADGSWGGWHDTNKKDGKGDPIKVPPYYTFFVHETADEVHVPILLDVSVTVQAGYEKYPKITRVVPHVIEGRYVQARMPRKVMPWIAEMHKWNGEPETITTKNDNIKVSKLDWKQIGLGHGGLKTWKDVR